MDQTAAPSPSRALLYDGKLGELYGLFLTNLLLTILTLGVFRFWAITRYRRYLWSRLSFQGQRFEYTGTGGELFVGFLLAGLLIIGMAVVAGGLTYVLPDGLNVVPSVLFYVVLVVLGAGAVFSAQRYRLSRTLWCGIRGGMVGSALAYGLRAIGYTVLVVLSLFQLYPWMSVRLAEARINASSFGDAQFSFRGRARTLYLPYLLTCIGIVVLLAVVMAAVFGSVKELIPLMVSPPEDPDDLQTYMEQIQGAIWIVIAAYLVFGVLAALLSSWYFAMLTRHIIGNSALGGLRFASSVTGASLLLLSLGNVLILLLTLGLGYPIVLHRNARFLAHTLFVYGTVDPSVLAQSSIAPDRFGEGMFQQLDASGAL